VRISVYGLGYVGAVSAACLAADGHTVVGIDTNPVKVDLLNQGQPPVVEAGLGELIEEGQAPPPARHHRLHGGRRHRHRLVCVGTPSKGNGSLDLTSLAGGWRHRQAIWRVVRPSRWSSEYGPAGTTYVPSPSWSGRAAGGGRGTPSSCGRTAI
jgi:UDP-glucose 6-dehydrogenase